MPEFSETRIGRFDLVRRIGEGAFGTVFEAHDREHGSRVALKVLRRYHYEALYGFKQEFRALADVFHPNLVRLHELTADGEAWFFTMELVEGVTFLEHVWRCQSADTPRTVTNDSPTAASQASAAPAVVDVNRLRNDMIQLVEGLMALHERGKVHRDVKPSNVLVSGDGRVVLLDFGLLANIVGSNGSPRSGTPGYMSPEQAQGKALGPGSDWYAVGVMLHEALTGALPRPRDDLLQDLPEDLLTFRRLCQALLSPDPAQRPNGRELLAQLRRGLDIDASQTRIPEPSQLMVGRGKQFAELEAALSRSLSGRGQLVRVVGRSGIGKTKLVQEFLRLASTSDEGLLVLTGRCYEHETVPYKALDSLIDALGRHVFGLDRAQLLSVLTPESALLGQLFSVFRALPTLPDEMARAGPLESQEQRSLAFNQLRQLVHRLTKSRPLVLFVDDVHWGDADSARLLAEIIRAPCRERLLVILGYRPDGGEEFMDVLDEAELGIEQQRLEIAELPPVEARMLAQTFLPEGPPEVIEAVVASAGGNPIFIEQLAHQALSAQVPHPEFASVDAVVNDRIERLAGDVQSLLQVVAVAGQPVPSPIAALAAQLDASAARAAGYAALDARLLTMQNSRTGVLLDLTHDRVRITILAGMSAEQCKALHQRLAATFLEYPRPDVDALARHFAAAGDGERVAEYGRKAAERAESVLAFDRAARHWALLAGVTLESEPERWRLLKRWGEALTNAGKAGEASDVFERASLALSFQDSRHTEALPLSRRSGELALRSGRFDVGIVRMEAALRRVGVKLPQSRPVAAALALGRRFRFILRGFSSSPRRVDDVALHTRDRLDALWGASTGLSMANYVVADALGVSHLLEALDHGSHSQVIRALGYEAAFEALIGGSFFRGRAERMLKAMDGIAAASGAPYDRAWARMSRGIVQWFMGDWASTFKHCCEAAVTYREQCRGVAWELAICDSYRIPTLICLGDLSKVAQMVPRALSRAYERGDRFAAATLRMGQHGILALRDDAPDRSKAESDDAIAEFPTDTYLLPHYQHLFAIVQAELYAGRGERAHSLTIAAWPSLKQSRLLKIQCLRVEMQHMKGRAALAHALSERAPAPRANVV